MSAEAPRPYYRSMKVSADGGPRCGPTGACLGVRPPVIGVKRGDIPTDASGRVVPNSGGLSVTPDDPAFMPEEFRPETLDGGLSRLPLFMIQAGEIGSDLQIRPDPRKPRTHHFFEPVRAMHIDAYQGVLCATAPRWRRPG